MSRVASTSLIIIAICATCCLTGCSRGEGEVTVYQVRCDDSVPKKDCWSSPTKPFTLNPTVYRVSEPRQSVIYWSLGPSHTPHALSNCVVRDMDDWICDYDDLSGKVEMQSGELTIRWVGEYSYLNEDSWAKYNLQVSWATYQMTRLREIISSL